MDLSSEKAAILGRYGISITEPLHSGMEAEVYAFDDTTVLKLYPQTTTTANLETLQRFYASLVDATLSYALPEIHKVEEYGSYTVVLEKRLHGRPLSALVAERTPDQLDDLLARYIAAVDELSHLTMPPYAERYKLFDPDGISARLAGDWHTFLRRYLDQKLTQTAPYFARDVTDFAAKVQQMQRTLAASYLGPHALIHGDFFPGNLLVDEQGCPTALLDFGLFTMYGDPLFDLATAWVLFDMYDEWQANLRERLLLLIIERFGETIRPKLYQYLLLYSFLSANTYAPDCSDGHYAWCVANLNTAPYWANFL